MMEVFPGNLLTMSVLDGGYSKLSNLLIMSVLDGGYSRLSNLLTRTGT